MLVCLVNDDVVSQCSQKLAAIQLVSVKLAIDLLDFNSDFGARLIGFGNDAAEVTLL